MFRLASSEHSADLGRLARAQGVGTLAWNVSGRA